MNFRNWKLRKQDERDVRSRQRARDRKAVEEVREQEQDLAFGVELAQLDIKKRRRGSD